MGVHLYTNGAWTDSGWIYRNSENLFDSILIGGIFQDNNFNISGSTTVYKSIKIYLTAGSYTFSWGNNVNVVRLVIDGSYSQPAVTDVNTYTITLTTDGYVGISFRDTTSESTEWDDTTPIMLNVGSTAIPYEPYNIVDWYINHGHGYSSGAWS